MMGQKNRLTFNQRLQAIEMQRARSEAASAMPSPTRLSHQLLRAVAIVPVVVVLAKAWTMAFMGVDAYLERLVEIHAAGGIAAATAVVLVPDRLSLGLAGMLVGLPGLS